MEVEAAGAAPGEARAGGEGQAVTVVEAEAGGEEAEGRVE